MHLWEFKYRMHIKWKYAESIRNSVRVIIFIKLKTFLRRLFFCVERPYISLTSIYNSIPAKLAITESASRLSVILCLVSSVKQLQNRISTLSQWFPRGSRKISMLLFAEYSWKWRARYNRISLAGCTWERFHISRLGLWSSRDRLDTHGASLKLESTSLVWSFPVLLPFRRPFRRVLSLPNHLPRSSLTILLFPSRTLSPRTSIFSAEESAMLV